MFVRRARASVCSNRSQKSSRLGIRVNVHPTVRHHSNPLDICIRIMDGREKASLSIPVKRAAMELQFRRPSR